MQQKKESHAKTYIGLIVFAGAIWWIFFGGSGPATSKQLCEELWEENKVTAYDPVYMTKDRYIANCMDTNESIMNGEFGK